MPVAADVSLSKRQWKEANFPSFSMPDEVTTHVNTKLWGLKVKEVQANPKDKNFIPILEKVYKDLVEGSDSKFGPPGSNASKSPNFFPEPEVDIPRIADALASEVKAGHMAGPFQPGFIENAKIKGFFL